MDRPYKLGSALSFLFVFYAAYYRHKLDTDSRLAPVSESLLQLERASQVAGGERQPRVALGYGACYDLFVNASAIFKDSDLIGEPQNYNEISTMEELISSFAYFFKHGAAAERFVSNSDLYEQILSKAKTLPDARWSIGGNAPLMGMRFNKEGWKVLLGAKMKDELKSYIPEEIMIVGDNGDLENDDVHMIIEYQADVTFGEYKTPRANRFIIHNDENNPLLSSLEMFGEALFSFRPDLLIISGLQMMDSYPFKKDDVTDVRADRLDLVREQILSLPLDTLTHFEMASFVDLDLLLHLAERVLPVVDSVGMNEQELANLLRVLEEGRVSVLADSNPRVATALDQMRKTFTLIRQLNAKTPGGRSLTRIHVHTLAYQAIMTVTDSRWRRTQAAAAKAALTAHRYVCNSTEVDLALSRMLLDDSFSAGAESSRRVYLDPADPVPCWEEAAGGVRVLVCVAPVVVCTQARLTAGAGDNISAAGLVLQIEK